MAPQLQFLRLHIRKSLLLVSLFCFSFTGLSANLQITGTVPNTTVDTALLVQFYANNGTGPFSFSLATSSGNLPDGVTLSTSGVLSGIPKEVGSYPFIVQLDDQATLANPGNVQQAYTLYVTPPDLNILTSTIPGLVFDTSYSFQMLGEGGSGNYQWSIASGAMPNGFTLGATTGLLTGSFNLLTADSIGTYTFTVQMEDRDHPLSGNALHDIRMAAATASFSISPDTGSYCWEIYKTGEFHVARSHHLGDYCYLFFEGTGIDIYLGTENRLLDEPSSVTIDGETVTPTPVDGITRVWTSEGHTEWVRYRLSDSLADGPHIVKMVAPTSYRNTIVGSGNHIGGRMAFESIQIRKPFYDSTGRLTSRYYYVRQDVIPEDAIYRCGENGPGIEVLVDPDIKVVGSKLTFEAFPQETVVTEARQQQQLADTSLSEIQDDLTQIQNYLILAEEAETGANLAYGLMTQASDNATLLSHYEDLVIIAGNASEINLEASTLNSRGSAYATIAANASTRATELAGQDISANDIASRTSVASASVSSTYTSMSTIYSNISTFTANTQSYYTLGTTLAAVGVSSSANTESSFRTKPGASSLLKPAHFNKAELVSDLIRNMRGKSLTEESVPYIQLFNEDGERTGTLFGDHTGEINLPDDTTLFKVAWGNPDDATTNFETELTTPEEARTKFGEGTSSSDSSSISTVSSGGGGGGGGGGCLLR